MKDSVYMAEMDAFTYREKIANNAIVFVPVGALEQHGSHMAMCVDAYLTKAMAGATAEKVGGICAEPIIYGFKSQQRSGGGFHLTGTTNLDGSTLIAVVRDICRNIAEDGARKIVFMNGHYENYQFVYEGVDLALRDLRMEGIDDVEVMLMSYWDFVDDKTIEELYPEGFTGWDLEHAGVMETSLMLLLYPDLVDMDRIDEELYVGLPAVLPNYDVLPIKPEYTPPSGCLSHPGASTKEKGEILRDVAVKNMVDAIEKEFGA
ncbi:creatininase [Eggerthellaceae bacterium 3-80]|nr:creatininase [bacterium D16-34]